MSPVNAFSAVSLTMWVAVLVWSIKQGSKDGGWYNVWVLLLATAAWWLGECVAIRLGKYEYDPSFGLFAMPFAGSPGTPDWLATQLTHIHSWLKLPPVDPHTCVQPQTSWSIPAPIIALESCLVVAFLRLSSFRLHSKGFAAACAAGCFSAFLMVTLASVLDPVVSTTQWCGLSSDPAYHGLTHVHLWRWFTNETYTGYWFGVPMVNYMSWFVGMYVFTFMSRLDDDGPRGIVRHYDRWYKYVGAALATLAIVFGIEFVLKIGIDVLLVRGREFLVGHVPVPGKLHWEFAVMASLLVLNLVVVWRFGRTHPNPQKLRWVAIVPPAAVLAFCLWCLFHEPLPVLCAVWLLSAATSVLVVFWPVKFTVEKHREQRQAETASV